jgi:hypothetical protein
MGSEGVHYLEWLSDWTHGSQGAVSSPSPLFFLSPVLASYPVRPTRVQINSYPASARSLSPRVFLFLSSLALPSLFFLFRCDNTPRLREQDVSSPGNFGNNRRRFHVFHGEWRVSEHLFISRKNLLLLSRPSPLETHLLSRVFCMSVFSMARD